MSVLLLDLILAVTQWIVIPSFIWSCGAGRNTPVIGYPSGFT